MKIVIRFLFLTVLSACISSCDAERTSYSYKGFDSSGVLVIEGVLNLQISDTNKMSDS